MSNRALIKEVFVRHGFKLSSEAGDDLKDYVYEAAEALLAAKEQARVTTLVEVSAEVNEGMLIETVRITDGGTVVRRVYPETTKHCPLCFNEQLVLQRTFNLKWCSDCNTEVVWPLKEGQKSLA